MKQIGSGRVLRSKFFFIVALLAAAGMCMQGLAAESTTTVTSDGLSPVHPLSLRPDLGLGSAPLSYLPIPKIRLPVPKVAGDVGFQTYSEELPFPRTHFTPISLSTASALQVAAASSQKLPAVGNTANPARTSTQSQSVPVRAVVPPVRPTASAPAAAVKSPVAIHRSSTPALVEVSKARTVPNTTTTTVQAVRLQSPLTQMPLAVGTVSTTTLARQVLTDPHVLPEYRLVQLPAQAAPPMPAQSLPVLAQDFSGTQGQMLSIKLTGRGWIYTGTGKTPAGLAYIEKTVQAENEQFRFRLDLPGRHVLQFQRQDVASGLLDRQEAAVTIQSRVTGIATGQMQTVSITHAPANQYQPEFQIPQDVSAKLTNPAPAYAPVGAVTVTPPSTGSLPTDAAGLFALAVKNDSDRQSAAALALYEKIAAEWPAWDKNDEVLYRTARLLESASDGKNVQRAYDLYLRIQKEYPYSSWVDQSRERGRYISRSFFHQ